MVKKVGGLRWSDNSQLYVYKAEVRWVMGVGRVNGKIELHNIVHKKRIHRGKSLGSREKDFKTLNEYDQ